MTRKEEGKNLLKRSSDFLKTADYQADQGFYDLMTFSLEQALELFLKAKVLEEGIDFPRSHSVRKLVELLLEFALEDKKPKIRSVLKRYALELGMLEDAYITSRYVMRDFTKEEAEKLSAAVREIMKNVQ